MATGGSLTLLDLTSRLGPDQKLAYVGEMLSQANDILGYLPLIEGNEIGGHEFVFRTSIPAGAWRQYNAGVPYSKSTTAKARVGIGALEDYSQIDRMLAEDSGDVSGFRLREDAAFLEGMGQTIVQTFWYGNTVATPAEFMGLAPFYNTVNQSSAANAANVIDAGGQGSSNASLWLLGLGDRTIFGVYPRGSTAGLKMEDKGTVRAAYDNLGNPFEAYTSWFRQQLGVCPQDWRYGVRIANIDTTSTAGGLASSTPPDLFALLAGAMMLPPTLGRTTSGITKTDAPEEPTFRPIICCNRTVRHWLDIQAIRNKQTLLAPQDSAGLATVSFRGIDIAVSDQLLTTEARVV